MRFFCGLIIACLLVSCNLKLDNDEYRAEFVSSCADEFKVMDESVADSVVLTYCNCAAEKILTHFDVIDLVRLNDTTSQVYKESQELIIPCMEVLNEEVATELVD